MRPAYSYDRRTAGLLKNPPKLQADLQKALFEIGCSHVWGLMEGYLKLSTISQGDRVEALRTIQFCKKFSTKPKIYKRTTKTKVPVDLRGWTYLDETGKKKALATLSEMTLEVAFKSGADNPGFWRPSEALLHVNFPNATDLDSLKFSMLVSRRVLEHETRHVAQSLMEYGGHGDLLPPALRKQNEKEWALRNIELQPIIGDAVNWLSTELEETTPKKRRQLVQEYVGERPSKTFMLGAKPIQKLRKEAPDKWRYAVREIFKGVNHLL